MKTKKIIAEIICFVLLMYWFYEGIYKVVHLSDFGLYITHAPLLKSIGRVLKYVIPFGEVGLAILFVIPKYKMASLYISIGLLIAFLLWIMSVYLFAHRLFFSPYHAWWQKPIWMHKMLISLGLCWFGFVAIILSTPGVLTRKNSPNSLYNSSANTLGRSKPIY